MAQQLSAREILDKLVGFQTVSRDSNLDLIDWVETYLKGFGVEATRVYNAEGTKAALYANVGPTVEGGVVLLGPHRRRPRRRPGLGHGGALRRDREGRASCYGRGTCDMKGFDAIALAAVPYAL